MKYRADIDGLRALAIIPVLLYHIGVPGFGGGFVGVDVFLVISGYLICGMIDADIRNGTFSLGNFYKRRILRILPALLVMLLVTSVLTCVIFLPVELQDYSRSLAAAIASVANIYFAQTAGYFEAPAETKPLLHTWSLGVEEQFYFIVPLLMLIVVRLLPRGSKWLFAIGVGLSLAAALAVIHRNESFVFYLAPFRAWELGLGALLSIGFIRPPQARMLREACGAIGLVLVVGAILFGSPSAPLLLMTSLASVGATLVIASSERGVSLVGRLLSLQPIVFIGLISYSLYLWHWPLTVFQRTDALLSVESPTAAKLTLIVTSVGLAYLSWRLIELPFRALARKTSKIAVFAGASTAMASTLTLCALVLVGGGAPSRFPRRVVAIGAYLAYDSSAAFRTGRCFLLTNRQRFDVETCMTPDPKRANYLLMGDGHAAHLWFGLSSALPDVHVMQASASMCRPAISAGSRYETPFCRSLLEFAFNDFLVNNRVDRVVLAASWKDEDISFLSATLEALKARGLDVVVLGPIVEYDSALPRLLVDEILRGDTGAAAAMRRAGVRERDQAMSRMVAAHGATYLSVYDAICRDGRCDEYVEGDVPMQFDIGRLTAQGSIEVGRRLAPLFVRNVARADHASN